MNDQDPSLEVTQLLREMFAGDIGAGDQVLAAVYDQLHSVAQAHMHGQPMADSVGGATGLLGELFVKLRQSQGLDLKDREHFLRLASCTMRSILVDHVRSRSCAKRTPPGERLVLDEVAERFDQGGWNLLLLDEALRRLGAVDPQAVRLVELHYFGGLTVAETASVARISVRSVERELAAALAWLRKELR